MQLNDYQAQASTLSKRKGCTLIEADFAHYAPSECSELLGCEGPRRALFAALGLCGEAGEVANEVKKVLDHGHPFNLNKLRDELGDVLWYLAELSSALGIPLSDVSAYNLVKLKQRYPNGFSVTASVNRNPDCEDD